MSSAERPTAGEALHTWESSPVIVGENPEEYQALRRRIADTLRPRDLFEEDWAEDLVYQIWEIRRYRKMIGSLVKIIEKLAWSSVCRTTGAYLVTVGDFDDEDPDADADPFTAEMMKIIGDKDLVAAEAFAMRKADIQTLSQMMARAEARRNRTLREIEHHREGLGKQLRAIADEFEGEKVGEHAVQSPAVKLAA